MSDAVKLIDQEIESFEEKLQLHSYHLYALRELRDRINHKTGELAQPVESLGLSIRAKNCLKRSNIYTVNDVCGKTRSELLEIDNFGKKCLLEVSDALAMRNLSLKKEVVNG